MEITMSGHGEIMSGSDKRLRELKLKSGVKEQLNLLTILPTPCSHYISCFLSEKIWLFKVLLNFFLVS